MAQQTKEKPGDVSMKRKSLLVVAVLLLLASHSAAQGGVSIDTLLSASFPENLVAAKSGNRLAWTLNDSGKRNVWVAEGPGFAARRLTPYPEDDGAEISTLSFSDDGKTLVYVRGEGKNLAGQYGNPTSDPAGAQRTLWAVDWQGGSPRKIDEGGDGATISTKGLLAYTRDGHLYLASLNDGDKPMEIVARGNSFDPRWSPDGSALAFVSGRGDHSFVAIYAPGAKSLRFIAPSVDRDSTPQWSPDGKRIAFIRRPSHQRDDPQGFFLAPDRPQTWAIWIADASNGSAREAWHSGARLEDSYPAMATDTGGGVLHWAAENRLVIASERDGWQHLYALSADGTASLQLLTPGSCEVEQWSFTPDASAVVYNSNCGDSDRRHLWQVDVRSGSPQKISTGEGIEWSPQVLSDGKTLAYLGSDATHPGRALIKALAVDNSSAVAKPLAAETWPKNFPSDQLVTPQPVTFRAADGLEIHGQLFLPKNLRAGEKRPALLFMHGGPIRQMLLGWHYMYYYANSYAMNQFLASRGYIALSVNYRSGIGYGRAFREAPGRAGRGASEYADIVAAGKYLQSRADVDSKRIGLWGGSYGGFLTAMGLARNSDIFAAGVDTHGVHDWNTDNWEGKNISPELNKLARDSSPVSSVDTWKSPVLFIHGDDDRNVHFTQTVDLIARLRARGVELEQLVFPDEIHDFLLNRHWIEAYRATSDFFDRHFQMAPK
jgi:dipeptidyl aminopeptidase/acylaminoacyl peptidase